jgi:hypothetical protein
MKCWPVFFLMILSATAFAETINEADYPVQYEVMNANAGGNWMAGNFCTMALRDGSANMILVVQRHGHGACHIPDSGTILHGRRDKNEIQLLSKDEKGVPKIERWPIKGTSEARAQH